MATRSLRALRAHRPARRRFLIAAPAALAGIAVTAILLSASDGSDRPWHTLRNPVDAAQLTPFGTRSHWLQPWRAYLDTRPAAQLRDAAGINFNVDPAEADSAARLLAASGFRRARV